MARTISEIRAEMIAAKETFPELSGLNATSVFSVYRLWIYLVSVAIWTLENVQDISIIQQSKALKDQKRYSLTDYSNMSKQFQYGYDLPPGEVEYDNSDLTPEVVEASKVVKFASAQKIWGGLKIKIAGISDDGLAPVTEGQFEAFKEYIGRVKAAGDYVTFTNEEADHLRLELKIFRNPLILDAAGKRTDGTNDTPIQDAIENFIKAMDFDKKFIPAFLIDAIQAVEGVEVPDLLLAQSRYAAFPFANIPAEGVNPNAGYLRIYNPSDLIITYEIWEG